MDQASDAAHKYEKHAGCLLYYDIEIRKAVPDKKFPAEPGIEYCAGWTDHANMGVACICAYDVGEGRYRVWTDGTFEDFIELAQRRRVVGFNSVRFDDVVCGLEGIPVTTTWDLLREMWKAEGLNPDSYGGGHSGFSLNATAKANGLPEKTWHGAVAGAGWQMGQYGRVIDYCLFDVHLLRDLTEMAIMSDGHLAHPRRPGDVIVVDTDAIRLF